MRILSPLAAVSFGLLTLSACAAVIGIKDVPEEAADGSLASDASAAGDASTAADTGAQDANATADGSDGMDAGGMDAGSILRDSSLPDATFPYSDIGQTSQIDSGAPQGLAVSPAGTCLALALPNAIEMFQLPGDSPLAPGSFQTPGQMVFDSRAEYLFAQHGAGKNGYATYLLANCAATLAPSPVFIDPTDGGTTGPSLGVATGAGSLGTLFVGALLVGKGAASDVEGEVFAFDIGTRDYHGSMVIPGSGVAPSLLSASVDGNVVAAVVNGHLSVGSLGLFGTAAAGTMQAVSALDGGITAVAVDPTGASIFVLAGASSSQTLYELVNVGNDWQPDLIEPIASGSYPGLLNASERGLIVSPGSDDNRIYVYATARGRIVSVAPGPTFTSPVNGVSTSTTGGDLAVSTATGTTLFMSAP